jgi:hypothetical protein
VRVLLLVNSTASSVTPRRRARVRRILASQHDVEVVFGGCAREQLGVPAARGLCHLDIVLRRENSTHLRAST